MKFEWPFVALVTVLVGGAVGAIALGYEEVSPLLVIVANLMKPAVRLKNENDE